MAASEQTGKLFWIAEQEQYAPAILTAQRLIAAGEIGETVTLHTMGAGGQARGSKPGDAPVRVGPDGKASTLRSDDFRLKNDGFSIERF